MFHIRTRHVDNVLKQMKNIIFHMNYSCKYSSASFLLHQTPLTLSLILEPHTVANRHPVSEQHEVKLIVIGGFLEVSVLLALSSQQSVGQQEKKEKVSHSEEKVGRSSLIIKVPLSGF